MVTFMNNNLSNCGNPLRAFYTKILVTIKKIGQSAAKLFILFSSPIRGKT